MRVCEHVCVCICTWVLRWETGHGFVFPLANMSESVCVHLYALGECVRAVDAIAGRTHCILNIMYMITICIFMLEDDLKRIYPKMKTWSVFSRIHVIPNLYNALPWISKKDA